MLKLLLFLLFKALLKFKVHHKFSKIPTKTITEHTIPVTFNCFSVLTHLK